MKRIPLLLLLIPLSAFATNFTVKAGGGGNFITIQACATAMAAGDTCTVLAGTYAENVTLTSGSAGLYKTLTVNPGDTVNVLSFAIASYDKLNGFHIQNPSSPTSAPCVSIAANATQVYVTNNTMYACNEFVSEAHGSNQNTTFVYIQGNTMSYSCSTSSAPNVCTGMTLQGDYQLIENNDISHVSDWVYLSGHHIVVRKNNFHDTIGSDCGSNSGNCHVDFQQSDVTVPGNLPAEYYLFEGNTINNMINSGTSDMHGIGLFQAESCNNQCQNGIVRFNVVSHVGDGAVIDDNSGATTTQAWINVKTYNNSWVDVNHDDASINGSGTNGYTHGSTGWAELNELFYYPQASMPDFNPYVTDSTTVNAGNYGYSLAFCTGTCTLRGHIYGSGTWLGDPGNKQADPLFVNYSTGDYHLQATSPALAAGTKLTTVNGAATSSTTLVVADAGYFQDGSGISGVSGDCVAVTAATNHVCITAVNYATNTLTLASPITAANGDPVWLYSDSSGTTQLAGTAPNIGALGTSAPASPFNLSGIVVGVVR